MSSTKRFKWTSERDAALRRGWLSNDPAALALQLGCTPRAVYLRAKVLNLGPREPVRRALWLGAAAPQPGVISLPQIFLPSIECGPTTDELAAAMTAGSGVPLHRAGRLSPASGARP